MSPKFLLTCWISFYCLPIFCQQHSEEISVRQAIYELFEGMYQSDSARAHRVFHPEMRLMTVATDKSGVPMVQATDIQKFLNSLGTPRKEGPLDERIWSYKIQVDGRLASAWTPYSFYVGSQFSHCGTNTFQLVKMQDGWNGRWGPCRAPPNQQNRFFGPWSPGAPPKKPQNTEQQLILGALQAPKSNKKALQGPQNQQKHKNIQSIISICPLR